MLSSSDNRCNLHVHVDQGVYERAFCVGICLFRICGQCGYIYLYIVCVCLYGVCVHTCINFHGICNMYVQHAVCLSTLVSCLSILCLLSSSFSSSLPSFLSPTLLFPSSLHPLSIYAFYHAAHICVGYTKVRIAACCLLLNHSGPGAKASNTFKKLASRLSVQVNSSTSTAFIPD